MRHMRHCCARGAQLPQTKLQEADVRQIRELVQQRQQQQLRQQLTEITNKALARRFGVHWRTIEKVLAMETHYHVR